MRSLRVTIALEGSACILLGLKHQTRENRSFGDITCMTMSPVKVRRIQERRKCNWFVQASLLSGQRDREYKEQPRSWKTFQQHKQARNSSLQWNREETTVQQDIFCTERSLN